MNVLLQYISEARAEDHPDILIHCLIVLFHNYREI